ncbi:hypothetical protein WMY93_031963 [Mugilogobius chulae]|uniref:Uncharacterized protein n=1 Tax=Mugilogobius chulae TaxID=88201 RepID=A0AAW0MCS8_9GOBI
MPAGMKPLEKFLKKQGSTPGVGGAKRRASLSRVVPFFRETSPDAASRGSSSGDPDSEDPPTWPSVAPPPAPPPSANGPAPSPAPPADVRSPSLSSDEQSSEEPISSSSERPGPALLMDTPTNVTLAVLEHVTRQRHAPNTEILLDDFMLTHPIFVTSERLQQLLLQQSVSTNTPLVLSEAETCSSVSEPRQELHRPGISAGIRLVPGSGRSQDQTGPGSDWSRIRLVPGSDWSQDQTGPRIRLVPGSDWSQDQTGPRIRLVPGSVPGSGRSQDQTGPRIRPVLGSGRSQDQTGPRISAGIRLVPGSDWSQDQAGPGIRLVPGSDWSRIRLVQDQAGPGSVSGSGWSRDQTGPRIRLVPGSDWCRDRVRVGIFVLELGP